LYRFVHDVPFISFPSFLLQYTSTDAGYTPTDYVFKQILQREDCRWLSATNADNIYGTNIVENVRSTLGKLKPREAIPDMILTPLDSRNFAEQGEVLSR
jgi:hypothetical protein